MKKNLIWSVLILGIMTLMSFAQEDRSKEFVKQAILANRYEIAIAQQASERSTNDLLKAYSLRLVDHHHRALGELQQYAESHGWSISDELDEEHVRLVNSLGDTNEDTYDASYRDAVIASHEKSIDLLESAAADPAIQDRILKDWISNALPPVQAHLTEAQDLQLGSPQNRTENELPIIHNDIHEH